MQKVKATYVDEADSAYDDITLGVEYKCLSVSASGNAKIIDDREEENYLLSGEYEVIEQ